jgi:hypothetical protein
VALRLLGEVELEAHIDEDNYYDDDSEGEDAVANHKLLISVETVCHFWYSNKCYGCKVILF